MEKKFQFFRKLLLLTLLMLGVGSAFAAWDGSVATTAPATETIGDKTYYIIDTEAKLAWFAAQVNSGKKSYNAKLTANLDMGGQLWTPIGAGNNKNNYNGTFDGNKHVISNLYIAAEELIEKYNDNDMAQNIGFIGCFSGTVKNLILENIEVHGYGKGGIGNPSNLVDKPISIGTVVGWQSANASVIDGCYATGVVITSGDGQAVGGIVGNVGGGTVSNCYSAVDIYASGLAYVGGIAGYTKNYKVGNVNGTVNMESCIYAGNTLSTEGSATVNGNDVSGAAGAIIGYQYKGNVTLSNLYYDEEQFPGENAGIGATTDGSTTGTTTAQSNVNSAETICLLNKGVYNENDGSCSKDSPWEMGESGPALIEYSSDGYKITFDANEGSFAGNATSAVKYVKLDYVINDDGLVKPSRDDFAFVGWSANKNATEPDQNLGTASGAATFYAVWNPVYTITFKATPRTFPAEVGQTPESEKTVKVEKGKKIAVYGFDVPEPYHDNEGKKHSFMGWAEKEYPTEEDALIDENGLDNLPIATKNTTLYAVWVEATVFTVIFDANGHGTTVSRYQKTVYDQDVVVPLTEGTMPHEEGYVLNSEHGWCVKPECGKNDFFDFSTPISGNITLYANWDAIEYDISYENLNGANNSNPAKYTAAGLTLENLVSVDGAQEFKGWCVDEELKNCITSIPAGTTGDVTLYAKWEDVTYPIIYRAAGSGATGNVSQGVKYHGVPYTLLGESYDRPGYKQNGWTTSLDGEKVYELGAIYSENAPLTLYPHWANNLTVTQYGAVTINDYGDHKEAVINGNYGAKTKTNERDAVAILNDIEVSSVVMTRIFPVNAYTTIVLPFSVNTANIGGLKAVLYYNGIKTVNKKSTIRMKVLWAEDNYIKDENNEYVHYEHTDMEANTPYMLLMNNSTFTIKSDAYPITLEQTAAAEEDADGSGWTFRGVWKYKEWGAKKIEEGQEGYDPEKEYDPETGYAYGFSASESGSGDNKIRVGDFVRAGEGAWIRPMRAYLVKTSEMAQLARANGAYVKRPSVVQEELPEIMSIVIDNGRDDEQTTVIGHFNTRTGEIKMIPQNRTFDVKGRNVGNKANKARGAYYGKKSY